MAVLLDRGSKMADIYTQQGVRQESVQMQGGQNDTRAAQMLARTGEQMAANGKNIYRQQLRNSMTRQLNKAYAENKNNPAALDAAIQDIRRGTMEEMADPEVMTDALADFDLKSSAVLADAANNYAERQRAEIKTALSDAYNVSAEDLARDASGMFASDDENIKIGYLHSAATMRSARDATDNDGYNLFTDEQRGAVAKDISGATLTGLESFLIDPTTPPARRAEIVQRFNNGEYRDLFSTDDYTKAIKLINAAAKEMGVGGAAASVDDDYDTVMGATFKIQLDDWKDDSKDDWYHGAELEDLLDFRTNVSAAFAEHKISEKEANDIMTDSAPAMLHKINEYIDDGNGLSRLIFGERPMRSGLQKIQGKIADMDLSDDQQLYIYEDFLRRYRRGLNNVPGDDSRDNLQQNMANTLSDDVVRDYIETQNPNWDPKSSSAIVMGRTVYRTPESQNSPIKNGLYRVVKDANGNLYKQYRDTNGNFSQKSVLQRLG